MKKLSNYFELLKFSQQQNLLFYPYNKPPGDVKERIRPLYSDEQGKDVYKCQFCGTPITEDEIAAWADVEKKLDYTQNVNLTEENIKQFISATSALFAQIIPKLEQFIQGGQTDGNLLSELTMLEARVNTIPYFQEINYYEMTFGANYSSYVILSRLIKGIKDGQMTSHGWAQSHLNLLKATDLQYIESNLLNSLRDKYSNFSITQEQPICEECIEKFPKCDDCGKYITDGQTTELLSGGVICQNCLDDGEYGTCQECGGTDRADNMNYVEDVGNYCEDCYKEVSTDYENYRDRVEEEAEGKEYPFKDWFPEGSDRLYLDFIPKYKPNTTDNMVIDYLRAYGCEVSHAEYQKGYCLFGRRQFKINKFFERIRKDKKNTARINMKNPKDLEERYKIIDDEINLLTRIFTNSSTRTSSQKIDTGLEVVISQNIHDIAQMSTGRGWKSCMELGVGLHYEDVFCEVSKGGLVAYLIKKDDREIEEPLARISIKRFVNEAGQSLAMPEERVYGNEKPGFHEQVEEWLMSRQKELPKGIYERQGGEWSDTYGRQYKKVSRQIISLLKNACGVKGWYKVAKRYSQLFNFIFSGEK